VLNDAALKQPERILYPPDLFFSVRVAPSLERPAFTKDL
jgi:hypothetical protein